MDGHAKDVAFLQESDVSNFVLPVRKLESSCEVDQLLTAVMSVLLLVTLSFIFSALAIDCDLDMDLKVCPATTD